MFTFLIMFTCRCSRHGLFVGADDRIGVIVVVFVIVIAVDDIDAVGACHDRGR